MITEEEFLKLKPSAKLRLAIEDLEACEVDDRYVIDMAEWVRYRPKKSFEFDKQKTVCMVCLAGALLSRHFNIEYIGQASGDLRRVAGGLDDIRTGYIHSGLKSLMMSDDVEVPFIEPQHVVGYIFDPEKFKKQLRDIVKLFEEHGV